MEWRGTDGRGWECQVWVSLGNARQGFSLFGLPFGSYGQGVEGSGQEGRGVDGPGLDGRC